MGNVSILGRKGTESGHGTCSPSHGLGALILLLPLLRCSVPQNCPSSAHQPPPIHPQPHNCVHPIEGLKREPFKLISS